MIAKPFITQQQEFIVLNNAFFDYVMLDVSQNAWKVLCFIVRKTKGWHKEADRIPFSQIKEGTGLRRAEAIKAALIEQLLLFSSRGNHTRKRHRPRPLTTLQ